ncbi:MAG: S-layer protein [Clostridiaceae bacterium]|nr:S-layer protein [Clostridiaceae bacterium]
MKKLVIFLMLISLFLINMEIAAAASLSALSAPSYVNAFVYKSGNIQINWDNNVPDATGFTIQRKTDDGNYITLANVSRNTYRYNDVNITNGHVYTYRVYATSGSLLGEAKESYPVEYLFPSVLKVEPVSDSEIRLTWKYPYSNTIPETNYQTIIERREDGSSTWLSIGSVSGDQDTFVDTGLTEAKRYFYRIRTITTTSAPYLYYPNNSTGYYAITLLKAPTNVKAQITSTSKVKITWEDNSENETGYRIERKTGNGSFVTLKSLAANTTSYEDTSAVNGELYTYRVTPFGKSQSGTSSEEVIVPFLFPISFEIKETYNTQITLSWAYPGSGYIKPDNSVVIIERRESGHDLWEVIHTTKPGETEYTDNDLKPGTRYYYRIRSRFDDDFVTDYFPTANGVSEYTKLSLDTHFYGYAISDSEIRLEWDINAIGDRTVIIEKLSSSGVFERLTSLLRVGSYIDDVVPGSINTYRMKISAGYIDSDYTEAVDISAERINPVKNLFVKSVTPERVFITWEFDDATETGFEIWRLSDSEGIWKHIATTNQGQYVYSDTNIQNGETYSYRVRAVKSHTVFSRFLTTSPIHVSFPKPDGLLVISRFDDALYLGWDDFSDMERYYVVEYKANVNDVWHTLDNIPPDMTMYRFVPKPGIDYTIRVRAYNDNPIYESYSNEVFYSSKIPDIPTLFAPTIVGSNRVVIKWADLSDNEDEFVIYRKNNLSQEEYKPIGSVPGNTVVYSDETVLPQNSYSYIVRAKNAAGLSFESNEVVVETPEEKYFSDVSDYPWALDAIYSLSAMGIVDGDGKGNFNPSGSITRAEFIKLLVASFSFPETPIGSFEDVSVNDWYHRWVMTAYRHGIVEPDENGMFMPNMPITRQDIVYYSVKAIEAAGYKLEQPPLYILFQFKDYDQISPFAQSSFASLYYIGIINGIGNDKLGPLYTATWAEAATIIYRMLQVLKNTGN